MKDLGKTIEDGIFQTSANPDSEESPDSVVCDSRLIAADPHWSGGETVCDQSTLMECRAVT